MEQRVASVVEEAMVLKRAVINLNTALERDKAALERAFKDTKSKAVAHAKKSLKVGQGSAR